MPKSGEFYSFDEVLKRLKIDEQRLKKLVSEGEIRAFREGAEMKFRRLDIDNLDRTRPVAGSEDATAAIDLSAGGGQPSETLTDDLIFDEGDDVGSKEAGMATAEISSQDTFVDEGVGMSTEPLEVEGEPETAEVSGGMGKKAKGGKAKPAAGAAKPKPSRAVEEEEPTETGWCVALSLGAVVLIGAMFVSMDMAKSDRTTAAASGFSKWVGETFGK
jgi:cell division septation protein DedD